MLIRAGRLEHARAFLKQARPSDEEESIERLFLLGRIEMQLGMPSRAIERFETILARRPELTRVRLELAQAYYLTGHDDKAKRHFNSSLADELPSSVEAAVESFLRGIDARKKWSVSLSASMLPETRRSDREEVLIGGVPFRLDEDARASSGVGVLLSTGASYSPTITDDIRGVLAASAAAKVYERSDWNDISTSGDIGLTRLSDNGSVSGGLRLGRRWTGGDRYQHSLGPWAQARFRLSGSTHLGLALSAGYRAHDERPDRDGWRVAAYPEPSACPGQPDFDQGGTDVRSRRGAGEASRQSPDRPGNDVVAVIRRRAVRVAHPQRPRPSIRRRRSAVRNQAGRPELSARCQDAAPFPSVRRLRPLHRLFA